MNIIINTSCRSNAIEIMDDLSMAGIQLRDTLDKIAKINRVLGGNRLTINGIKELIKELPLDRKITILDVGCGNGDMLREIADYAGTGIRQFHLTGIDANADTIRHAEALSKHYTEINYKCENIFSPNFSRNNCDIIICTLTLHHFNDNEIEDLLLKFTSQSKIGIVINDLHRSVMAYRLFQLVCYIFRLGKMPMNDGLISILRGFKYEELRNFSQKLNFKKYSIRWKWAFRYQWIITNI